MSYVKQNLMPGENVMFMAQLHWAVFAGPIFFLGIGLVLIIISLMVSEVRMGMGCFALFFFLLGFWYFVRALIDYLTTEFAITDMRLIAKTGLIRRRSLELLLTKVESIGVHQPIAGRMFGYGTIIVVGTGGTRESFPHIADPLNFRNRINAQIP